MGNRAHVVFADQNWGNPSPAIYMHWNGGPDSVFALLAVLGSMGAHTRANDSDYLSARFCGLAHELLGRDDCLSLGLAAGPSAITAEALEYLDCGDNGVYVVSSKDGRWQVRRFISLGCDRDLSEMLDTDADMTRKTGEGSKKFAAIIDRFNRPAAANTPGLLEACEGVLRSAGYTSGEAEPALRELRVGIPYLDTLRQAMAAAKTPA